MAEWGVWLKFSEHFFEREFVCSGVGCCGGSAPMDSRLIDALEMLRGIIGKPLYINSGFRCHTHNDVVGSSPESQHPKGTAADVRLVPGMTIAEMAEDAEAVEAFNDGGIGVYSSFIHLDVRRSGPARWMGPTLMNERMDSGVRSG